MYLEPESTFEVGDSFRVEGSAVAGYDKGHAQEPGGGHGVNRSSHRRSHHRPESVCSRGKKINIVDVRSAKI